MMMKIFYICPLAFNDMKGVFCKIILLFVCAFIFNYPFMVSAKDNTYQKLLKRKISNKMMSVEKLMKEKDLKRFVTLSVVVNQEIIYCHYEKENRNKLSLVMCY